MWAKARLAWEESVADAPDVRAGLEEMGRRPAGPRDCKHQLAELWVQALSEATEDEELRKFVRKHMQTVHDFFAGLIRQGQAEGVFKPDLDVEAEAWLFLSGSILGLVGRRVGLLGPDEVRRVRAARIKSLSV